MIAAMTNLDRDQLRFVQKFSQNTIIDESSGHTSSSDKSDSDDQGILKEDTRYLERLIENKEESRRLLRLYLISHRLMK
jgi:hypothetical protein